MDQPQYSTLSDGLATILDPRKARGKRYPWHFLLMLIALALASGQRTVHAIADWVALHANAIRFNKRCQQLSVKPGHRPRLAG